MSGKKSPDDGVHAHLAESLRALAAKRTDRLTSHPEAEVLAAYCEGRLTPDHEDHVQEHLALCPDCAAQVADAARIAATEADAAEFGNAEVEDLWRSLRRWLEVDRGPPPAAAGRWWPSLPTWAVAAAASLLVAVLGLSVWVLELRRTIGTLSEPRLNTPVEVLVPGAFLRDAERRPTMVELRSGTELLTLIMSLSERTSFSDYSLEIAAGVDVLWRGEGLVRNAEGSFSVTLSRSWLSPGRYELRLFGHEGARRRQLATFPIEVRPSSRREAP